MARFGIVAMLELAVVLVFAAPLGLYGLRRLLHGDILVGGIGVGVAVALLLVEQFVWTPDDVPGDVAERLAARAVRRPGEGRDGDDRDDAE